MSVQARDLKVARFSASQLISGGAGHIFSVVLTSGTATVLTLRNGQGGSADILVELKCPAADMRSVNFGAEGLPFSALYASADAQLSQCTIVWGIA